MIHNQAGGGDPFAVIGVVYPAGSVCTCTSGSAILTAPDTSGLCVFSIPETGTWTVKITDGTNTVSKAPSITAQGQCVLLELIYDLYISNASTETAAQLKSAWTVDDYATLGKTGSYLYLESTGSGIGRTAFYTKGIDVTRYSKIELYGYASNNDSDGITEFGLKTSASISGSNAASKDVKTSETTYSIDISGLSGKMYPFVRISRYEDWRLYWKYIRLVV